VHSNPDPHDMPTPVSAGAPCRCGHAWEAHSGHTHLRGTPAPMHCACCTCPRYEPPLMPIPWRYALGAKVRYVLAPDLPWRVTGQLLLRKVDALDFCEYIIEPWTLQRVWMADRPAIVPEVELDLWPEEEPPPC
jgi:hypothetical protein